VTPDEHRRLLDAATRHVRDGAWDAARAALDAVAAAGHPDPDVHNLRGVIAQRLGRAEEAVAEFSRAVRLDPASAGAQANLATALKNAGRLHEAARAFEAALSIATPAPATLNNYANLKIALDAPGDAIELLEPVVRSYPDYAEAWMNLGLACRLTGRLDDAEAAHRRAVALARTPGPAHRHLAASLEASGRVDDAVATLETALAHRPDYWPALNDLGVLLERHGRYEAAARAFTALTRQLPDRGEPWSNLAGTLLALGSNRDALAATDAALARLGEHTTPLALKTIALGRLGELRTRRALLDVERFVKTLDLGLDPDIDAALVGVIETHPTLTFEPEGLTTRSGRQTRELADLPDGPMPVLKAALEREVAHYLATLPASDHPFVAAAPEAWHLTIWGTILDAPGGRLDAHIHAPNWLSGVYYPELPAACDADDEQGGFEIGCAPRHLIELADDEVVRLRPRQGRLFLFPSYFYHRTLPFDSGRRVSIAFDVVAH